ncbi:MAG: type IV pilus assembly protein PilM [Phycisphaerales bacterium]
MAGNVCWGIEVGAGAVKAVKLERTAEGVNVVDYALIPHKKVLSTPEIDEKEARRVALGALIAQHELKGASLAVSVPGHSTFARFAKLPPVEPKKIPDIVKFEAVQQIPFPIDDVEWDYQTFASPDMPDVEVGIFAMTREKVMETLAKWQDIGSMPETLTLSPLAAYNAISFDQQFSAGTPGTVILDVGTTSTDLIVAEGGRLWIRTFPIGGHQFTEALVTAFNLSYSKAEKLKKEAESTQHTRHVLQAMRPVFGDLAQDVQRSIGYYQSTHKHAKLTRLIGLGNTFNLPGLRKFLSQQLQIEVIKLEGWSRIKVDGPAERNAEFQEHAVQFATAVGCALQGLGLETINANLMPVAVVREAVWARKTPWFIAAACLGVAAGGAFFVGPLMDRTSLASRPKPPEIDSAKREAQALSARWKEAEGAYKSDLRAESAMLLLQNRDVYAYLLDDLGRMMSLAKERAPEDRTGPNRVSLREWETAYLAAPAMPEDFGAMPVRPGGQADPNADKPRVHVKLRLETTKPEAEADRLVNDAVIKWVSDNAKRAGVPYEYAINIRTAITKREFEKVQDQAAAARQPGYIPPEPEPMEDPEPERPRPGTGRRPVPTPPGGLMPPRQAPKTYGAPTGGGDSKPGAEDVNKIAPLPTPEPFGPPGSTVMVYTVEFDAIMKGPAPKEGGQ